MYFLERIPKIKDIWNKLNKKQKENLRNIKDFLSKSDNFLDDLYLENKVDKEKITDLYDDSLFSCVLYRLSE